MRHPDWGWVAFLILYLALGAGLLWLVLSIVDCYQTPGCTG